MDSVHGCGFCCEVLQVYMDENCRHREKSEKEVKAITESKGILHVEFKYIQRNIVEYATSGDVIANEHGKKGTLAAFLKKDGRLYALTAKHVAGDVGQRCYTEDGHQLGECTKVSKNLDLAVAQVDQSNVTCCDLSLKDEVGNSLKLPCTVNNNTDDLQNLLVYIRGAETKPGLGRIIIPFFQTMGGQHIIIGNFSSEPFCKEGDSGALVLGQAPGYRKEVWAVGTVIGAYTSRNDRSGESIVVP